MPRLDTTRSLRAAAMHLAIGVVVSAACHVDDVSLSERPCPCVDDSWTCIAARCVKGDGSCPSFAQTGDACHTLPPFPGGPLAAVDGYPVEHCGVPASTFDLAAGDALNPKPLPAGVASTATLVVSWAPDAFHLYAEIVQANVEPVPESPDAGYQAGDAFEVYVAGFAPEGGPFGNVGQDLGATHIIAAPPPTSLAATYIGTNHTPQRRLTADEFATRRTPRGYAVELALPWSTLTPAAQARSFGAGDVVGFDVALDVRGPGPSGAVQRYQSFFHVTAGTLEDAAVYACGPTPPFLPYCDDRSWCTPRLGL